MLVDDKASVVGDDRKGAEPKVDVKAPDVKLL